MQLLCYEGTLKETKWQAAKSKGGVLVFRMFHLDGCLPKDCLRSRWGAAFIRELRWETARGGCDVTNGVIWWDLLGFGRKFGYCLATILVKHQALSKQFAET